MSKRLVKTFKLQNSKLLINTKLNIYIILLNIYKTSQALLITYFYILNFVNLIFSLVPIFLINN